jgi:twinkle protein
MISEEKIQEIKDKADIVSVVQEFVKLKKTGSSYVGKCPFHNEKSASFSVTPAKAMYKCFGCGKSGDAVQFIIDHEKKSYPEAITFLAAKFNIQMEETGTKKEYVKPVARLEKLGAKALEWFEKERGISNNTLLRFGVTEAMEWMPQYQKEVLAVCFNYYRGEELVNIKFRGPKKTFKLAKDAELIFFNLNSIEGQKECVIVEGEMDCLSAHEAGIYNCISVPNGANAGSQKLLYLDNCWSSFEAMEKVTIAVDNDEPGRQLREELIRRLGADKCVIVQYPEACKDLNDVLVKHGKDIVAKIVAEAEGLPIVGVKSMAQMYVKVTDWYLKGYPKGAAAGIEGFDDLLTFIPGQLTTITGIPGHGKDEFMNMVMTSIAKKEGWRLGVLGFEEENEETASKIIEKYVGKSFAFRQDPEHRMTIEQYEAGVDFVEQHFRFINPSEINTDIESILSKVEELIRRFGINAFYLNPWNWITHAEASTDYISDVLSQIMLFAVKHRIHIFLVAHTTKMKKDRLTNLFEIPNLYDISGSAHFFNKTSNGLTVYRDYKTGIVSVYIQKVKQSWLGKIGFVSFFFNPHTRQYSVDRSTLKHSDGFKPIQTDLGLDTKPF